MTVVTEIRFNHIPKLQGLAQHRAEAAVAKAALDVEGHAKNIVPVDTGNLKNSIQTTKEGDLTAYVGPRAVEYAIHVEFGTRRMRAQPYLRPSAERVRPAFIKAMKQIAEM